MRILNNKNNSQSFTSGIKLGEKAVKSLHKIDDMTSVGQRIIIGSSALLLQPMLDFSNKKVDKKTRQTSASRSISRAIVGTLTGIAVRGGTIKLADTFAKSGRALDFKLNDKHVEILRKNGEKIVKNLSEASKDQLKNYSATIGTLLGLGIMLFTNFLIDVPGVNFGQNFIMSHFFMDGKDNKHEENTSNVGGANGASK